MSVSLWRGEGKDLSSIVIVMTTAVNTSSVIDVSTLSIRLTSCRDKKVQPFCLVRTPVRNVLPTVIHARRARQSC